MTPACYVISAAQWAEALDALGNAFALVLLLAYLSWLDWWRIELRLRRFLRRRRLARIRAARVSA